MVYELTSKFFNLFIICFSLVISHDEGQTQPFDQVKCKFIKINAFSISYSTRYVTSNREIRCIQCCHVQFSKIDSFPWIHDTIKWYNTFYRRINLAHLQRIHHRYPIRFISLWFQFGLWTVGINKKNDNLKFTAICDERKKLLLKLYNIHRASLIFPSIRSPFHWHVDISLLPSRKPFELHALLQNQYPDKWNYFYYLLALHRAYFSHW